MKIPNFANLFYLNNIFFAPNCKNKNKYNSPNSFCLYCLSNICKIWHKTKNKNFKHLSQLVKHIIKYSSTNIELHKINILVLICKKLIEGKKYSKKKYYIKIILKYCPKTKDFYLLHKLLY